MHYATFAQWSSQTSLVHRLDPRVKLSLLLAFVVSLALLRSPSPWQLIACLGYLLMAARLAELPIHLVLWKSLFVVPFVGIFSVIVYLGGDAERAWFILSKSYLSALSVLICVSATPLPKLIAAGRFFRVPGLLLEVMQLTYRYLFVLGRQASIMQTAFKARGGQSGRRAMQASSGMVAVLFSRSYAKATLVHQAMLGRGFSGILGVYNFAFPRGSELLVLTGGIAITIAFHFV